MSTPAAGMRDLEVLRAEIKVLVKKLDLEEEPGIFVKLCRLALRWEADPDVFRLLLVEEGLRASRASELKAVLLYPEVAMRFTAEQDPMPWKQALAEARAMKHGVETQAAACLVRRLLRIGDLWPSGKGLKGWVLERGAQGQARFRGPCGTLEVLRILADRLENA